MLPTVVSVQFKSLRCIELEGVGRYLRVDSSIDCVSKEYQTFVGHVSWLLALYMVVPLVYLILLYRASERLHNPTTHENEEQRKLEEARVLLLAKSDPDLRPLQFLFEGYRPQFWYW